MARARGDKEYRLPVKGLNTEANLLDFPQDYAVDINNILLDFDPMRMKPRLGHEVFKSYSGTASKLTKDTGTQAVSSFFWESIGGDSDTNLILMQHGDQLTTINAGLGGFGTPTRYNAGSTFDLTILESGTTKGTSSIVARTPLQYSKVKGHILITSEAINPTLLRLNVATSALEFAELTLSVRDTIGMESGIQVDERPTAIGDFPVGAVASTTTGLTDLSEEHEYNLYNQGWYKQRRLTGGSKTESDPIVEFDAENSEFPSNADIVYIGMVDSSGDLIFDAEFLKDQTFGSTPTARGHYVVNAFDIDRETPRTSPQDSGAFTGGGGPDGGTDALWESTFIGP